MTVRAVIHDHAQEFPRYDERLTTRSYHYAYSVAIPDEQSAEWTLAETRLFKHDLEKGPSAVHDLDRKSVGEGNGVSVRVDIGVARYIKKKKQNKII